MKEIRASKSVIKRGLQELAVSAACLVLSGALVLVKMNSSDGAPWFDILIFTLSAAAVIVSGALAVRACMIYKNAAILYDENGFAEIKLSKKRTDYAYSDIARVTYFPERERADIELKSGGKVALSVESAEAADFYRLLQRESQRHDFTVG